jgi:hypothetical protein
VAPNAGLASSCRMGGLCMSTVDVAEKVDIRWVLCVLVEMCDLYEQDMLMALQCQTERSWHCAKECFFELKNAVHQKG